nr:type IV secretion system DNA-binding domain-containing protein [uncultured Thiohalocapsa sp.]
MIARREHPFSSLSAGKLYGAMMMRGMSKSLRLMVCVDEAHKLCNDPKITDLAKEARKYGLGLILSSQETRDFHTSIFANAGTQIVLALEDADAGVMAKVYAQEKKDQGMVKGLILGQPSGVVLIRSTHFAPYSQVDIMSRISAGERAGCCGTTQRGKASRPLSRCGV